MIGLDTNLRARFYVDDPNDPEAANQRPVARRIPTESPHRFVPPTVVLELEGVPRAFHGFGAADCVRVVERWLGLPGVRVEDSGRAWPTRAAPAGQRALRGGLPRRRAPFRPSRPAAGPPAGRDRARRVSRGPSP